MDSRSVSAFLNLEPGRTAGCFLVTSTRPNQYAEDGTQVRGHGHRHRRPTRERALLDLGGHVRMGGRAAWLAVHRPRGH